MIKRILAVFAFALLAGSAQADDPLTYQDPVWGIQVQYPGDWKYREMSGIVGFVSPEKDVRFLSNVNVIARPAAKDLEGYRQRALSDIGRLPDVHVHGFGESTLGGLPAQHLLFTAEVGDIRLLCYQIFTVWEGHFFLVTYAADLHAAGDDFDRDLREARKIIDSFHLVQLN